MSLLTTFPVVAWEQAALALPFLTSARCSENWISDGMAPASDRVRRCSPQPELWESRWPGLDELPLGPTHALPTLAPAGISPLEVA